MKLPPSNGVSRWVTQNNLADCSDWQDSSPKKGVVDYKSPVFGLISRAYQRRPSRQRPKSPPPQGRQLEVPQQHLAEVRPGSQGEQGPPIDIPACPPDESRDGAPDAIESAMTAGPSGWGACELA